MTRIRAVAAAALGLVIISAAFIASPNSASACRCAGLSDLQAFENADAAATQPNDAGPTTFAAIYDQRGVRSALWPEASILVTVLASVLGIAGYYSWRDKRRTTAKREVEQ